MKSTESSFCIGVNERRRTRPPDLAPGLLPFMELSSRTATKDGLDEVMDS